MYQRENFARFDKVVINKFDAPAAVCCNFTIQDTNKMRTEDVRILQMQMLMPVTKL